jgi:hypothetical protein
VSGTATARHPPTTRNGLTTGADRAFRPSDSEEAWPDGLERIPVEQRSNVYSNTFSVTPATDTVSRHRGQGLSTP